MGRGQGRVFTLNPQEVHASNIAITSTLYIDKLQGRVLFDSGATHSFISPYFAKKLARDKTLLKDPLAIETPLGETIEVRYMYSVCVVEIRRKVFLANLIELTVLDFDVILEMDWLYENYASIDCYDKCIQFRPREGTEFVF